MRRPPDRRGSCNSDSGKARQEGANAENRKQGKENSYPHAKPRICLWITCLIVKKNCQIVAVQRDKNPALALSLLVNPPA